ncbi:MAG: hypothetical protein IPK53_17640 [bacterium]|nr:hypothetical protein [bacterium]
MARLLDDVDGDAKILDQHPSWINDSMGPLNAMWEKIGQELQEVLAWLVILRQGRNANYLAMAQNSTAEKVQPKLASLHHWQLARPFSGTLEYEPDHDLVRRLVRNKLETRRSAKSTTRGRFAAGNRRSTNQGKATKDSSGDSILSRSRLPHGAVARCTEYRTTSRIQDPRDVLGRPRGLLRWLAGQTLAMASRRRTQWCFTAKSARTPHAGIGAPTA